MASASHGMSVNFPAKAGPHLTDPKGMELESQVDLVGWLHTQMVYPHENGHPPNY